MTGRLHPLLDKRVTRQVEKYLAMRGTDGMVTARDARMELDITFYGPAWDFATLELAQASHLSKGHTILGTFEKAGNKVSDALELMEKDPALSIRGAARKVGVDMMAVQRASKSADKPRCPHCGSIIRHKPNH